MSAAVLPLAATGGGPSHAPRRGGSTSAAAPSRATSARGAGFLTGGGGGGARLWAPGSGPIGTRGAAAGGAGALNVRCIARGKEELRADAQGKKQTKAKPFKAPAKKQVKYKVCATEGTARRTGDARAPNPTPVDTDTRHESQ